MTVDTNPIYQRLTKDINWARRKTYERLAFGVPIGIVTICSIASIQPQYNPLAIYLTSLWLIIVGVSLIALAAAACVASAAAIHRLVHGDEFALIRLTLLTSNEIASAMVDGLKFRLKPLAYASNSALLSTIVGFVLVVTSQSGFPFTALFVSYLPLVLVLAYFVWLNIQYMNSAITGGVFLAVRLRHSSISGVSVTAGGLVVLTYVIGPVVTAGLVLALGPYLWGGFCLGTIALLYFVLPVVGNPMMLAAIEENLDRTRLSEDG